MTNKRQLKDVKIDSVSIVAAPTCEACGEPMKGNGDTRWICVNDKCNCMCKAVEVAGCYPFYPVK